MEVTVDFQRIYDLERGKVTLLAGRPGVGTESLALTIARGIVGKRCGVHIYAPDKLLPTLYAMWYAQEALVDVGSIAQMRELEEADRIRVEKAKRRMEKLRISFDDTAHGGTLEKVLRRAKRHRRLRLLVIACPLTAKGDLAFVSPALELARLQEFARRRNVAVLLLEMASKGCDSRPSHLVYPTDVVCRELYQDVTTRIFFTRRDYYDITDEQAGYVSAEIYIYRAEECERIPCTWIDATEAVIPYDAVEEAEQLYLRGEQYAMRAAEEDDPGAEELAMTYFKRAAAMHHHEAECSVAQMYFDREDYEEAIWRFEQIAKKGDVSVMLRLADWYLIGYEVEYDAEKGIYWLSCAAEKNNLDALVLLAECYLTGTHVQEDKEMAISLYRRAAEQGCEEALLKLTDLGVVAK